MDGTKQRLPLPGLAVALAFLALLVALTGTAVAATGGSFLLGKANKAGATSILQNTGKGPALMLKTKNLHIAPLSVNGNGTKVANLNADKLDGIDSAQFQRRVATTCGAGTAVTAIASNGTVTCGDDTSGLQKRVTGTCSGTQSVESVAADGTVTCGNDTSGLQKRVTGTCSGTQSVESVGADGSVACGNDTSNLQTKVTGSCTGSNYIQAIAPAGTVTCGSGPLFAVVNSDGSLARGVGVSGTAKVVTGRYTVTFNRNMTGCTAVGSVGFTGTSGVPPAGFVGVVGSGGNANAWFIATYDATGANVDEAFHLIAVC